MAASSSHIRFEPIYALLRRRRATAIGTTVASVSALALALTTVATSLEALLAMPPAGRVGTWIVILAVSLGFGAFALRRQWRRAGTLQTIAEEVERIYPEFRERLVAGLEFSTQSIRGSKSLTDAIIDEASEQLDHTELRPLLDLRPLVRSVVTVLVLALIFASLLHTLRDTYATAFVRLIHPTSIYRFAPSLVFDVKPGDTRVAKGDTLVVRIGLRGDIPEAIVVLSRDADSPTWRRDAIPVADSVDVTWVWPHLRSDGVYRVAAGSISSRDYRVRVVERPHIRRLSMTITYPPYTELEPETLPENEGHVSGVPGTRANISLEANKPIERASIVFATGETIALSIGSNRVSGTFSITRSTEYTLRLVDEYGYENRDPITYAIHVIPDEHPTVRIVNPSPVFDLGSDMRVALEAEAVDDFGFDRMEIEYRGPDDRRRRDRLPISRFGPGHARSFHSWDVGELDLLPEDRVTYRVIAWDNDRVSGPKRGESEEYVLRFPSAAEIFAETLAEQNTQIRQINDVRQRGQETTERFDALRRELLKTENLTWESRQEMANILEQQQEMNREIERLASDLRETLEKLDRNDVLSPETLEKVSEIQKLMSDIVSPELREALRQLQRTSEQTFDSERLQRAMESLAERREEFESSLERILNLLREAQADQQLDAMERRLQELARMQQNVVDQFPDQSSPVLAGRERSLSTQTYDATEQLSELAVDLRDIAASPSEKLQLLAEKMRDERVSERLEQLAESLRSDGKSEARQREAASIAEQLRDLSQQMQEAVDERRERRRHDITEKIDRAARDLLRLSMMQEDLKTETAAQNHSDRISEIGEVQVDLRVGTASVIDRVMETAQETFVIPPDALKALSQTLRSMHEATRAIEQNRADNARVYQQQAMTALNQSVIALRQASEDARTSGSSTGVEQLLQQLEQMAQRQQQINDAMEQMQGQGELTSGDMEMLAMMAAQQQALAQMMQQMAGEIAQYREILGRLGNLGDEMEESARDIAQGNLGERLRDRQQRILQRLLDAQRSLSTGKESEERIAEASRDRYDVATPGRLPSDRGERRIFLREAMHEALRADFPPEYRSWIRSYYERLLEAESTRE